MAICFQLFRFSWDSQAEIMIMTVLTLAQSMCLYHEGNLMSIIQNCWDPHSKKNKTKTSILIFPSRLSIRPFLANFPVWYLQDFLCFQDVLYRKTCHTRVNFEPKRREAKIQILYHPENTPGNQRFSGVFRGYEMGTFATNEFSPRVFT